MTLTSLNPTTGERLAEYPLWDGDLLEQALAQAAAAVLAWQDLGFAQRAEPMQRIAAQLRDDCGRYGALLALEMGKPLKEARAEVEKCAWVCEFFAGHAARLLQAEPVATEACRSYVAYEPLGTVLAVMPWNYPFWQVFRCAVPALMAGNGVLLKHASNVPQCAEAIEGVFRQAGFPPGLFRWLRISVLQTEHVIADSRVHAVALTGSEQAGRRVASLAGAGLKKTVLELGGSDPFVVLADADLEQASAAAVTARFQNNGQSCIAAKRFILPETIADDFLALFRDKVRALRVGDPLREETQVGPLARADLREQLHRQAAESIRLGAVPVCGCEAMAGPGYFYRPSILDRVRPGMPAFDEELFGPVAAIVRVGGEAEALALANGSAYGLGASVWTGDPARGEWWARRLQAGTVAVNGLVHSDPRLPFGGIKNSGYGRELGPAGIREFVNMKSVWIA